MKKKILICANSDVGLYKFRKELIQAIISEGHSLYISLPKGEFTNELVQLGCEFVETPLQRRGTNPFKDFDLLKRYLKILKSIKPDAVLTYTVKPNIYAGLACSIKKIPYLVNITGLGTTIENEGLMQKLVLGLYRFGIKKAECVYFQNSSNKSFFTERRITSGKTVLLPGSGVNLNDFTALPYPERNKKIRFLFIGRIMRDKGINELFEAAKIVKERFPDVVFDILGDYDEDYSKQVEQLSEAGVICYHGQQKDVRPYLKDCFAVVHPSYHEGMANVLLEAAASARPVIASAIPGCMETFEEEVSGIGVKSRDAADLAQKLIDFIELPHDKKCEMGMKGRSRVEGLFDRNIIVNQYLQEINRVLEEK